jgi:hypothetical protein
MRRSRAELALLLAAIAAFACAAPSRAEEPAEEVRGAAAAVSAAFAAKIDAAEVAAVNAEIARLRQRDDAAEANAAPGSPPLVASVPVPAPAPTVAAAAETADLSQVRAELRRIGCYSGGDADWSAPEMRDGVAKYARYADLASPPAAPSAALLDDLKRRAPGFCPPQCLARETLVGGRCVAKSCAGNEVLDPSGACVAKPAAKSPDSAARAAPAKRPPGNCFGFNGSQFCE